MIRKTSFFGFLLPVLFFLLWVQPTGGVVRMIFQQLAGLLLFYSPFAVILFVLSRFAFPAFRYFIPLFSVIFSGLFSFLVLFFALPQVLSWWILFGVAFMLILVFPKEWLGLIRARRWEGGSWGLTLFLCLLIFNLFAAEGVGPFYPPKECDLSLYHLMLPKLYAFNGGWLNTWWTRFVFIPQLMHVQYALQISLFKGLGLRADLVEALTDLVLFSSMLSISRVFLSKRGTIWFGVSLLCVSLTRWNLSVAYMDMPSAAMIFGVAGLLKVGFEKIDFKLGVILGILLAATMGVKHMTMVFVLPILLAWAVFRWNAFPRPEDRRLQGQAVLGTAIGFVPPFVLIFFQNWRLTGNPLYPFFFPQGGGSYHWTVKTVQEFAGMSRSWNFDFSLKGAIVSFFEIMFQVSRQNDAQGFWFGFLIPMAFLLLFLCSGRKTGFRRYAWWALGVFLVQYFSWYFSFPVVRYLFPLVSLLLLTTICLLEKTEKKGLQYLGIVFLCVVFLHTQFTWYTRRPDPVPVTYSEVQEFYRQKVYSYKALEWVDEHTPSDSLIYTYAGSCSWIFSGRAFFGDWFGDTDYRTFNLGSSDEVREFILKNQPDYIMDFHHSAMRGISKLNLESVCLEEVSEFKAPEVQIFKRIKSATCPEKGVSEIRKTIPFQVKGMDFFFRRD